jgi:hypothetical protein
VRLTVVMAGIAVAGLLTAHPAVAGGEDVCLQAGWSDPVTGDHPRDGVCQTVTPAAPLCANPTAQPGAGLGVDVYACVPSATRG